MKPSSPDVGIFTCAVRELVAIGAAIAANCEPCFKYHYAAALELGVSKDDIRCAVEMAQQVKDAPAQSILELAGKLLGDSVAESGQPCCADSQPSNTGKCCG